MTPPPSLLSTPRVARAWSIGLTVFTIVVYGYVWKLESPIDQNKQRDYGAIRLADERNYYVHCADRVAEEGVDYLATEDSLRAPPLPWLWLLLFGRSIVMTRIANIGLIIAASWLIASIVRDRWGSRLALPAFALCALGYQVVLFGSTVLTEPLAYSLVCASLWAMHCADRRSSAGFVILSGVLTAMAAYARPSLQLWPFAIVVVCVAAWCIRKILRRKIPVATAWTSRRVALLVAVHCAVLAPWIIKNLVCFGVPRIANGFGAVLYLGSDLRTDGDEPIFSGMNWPNHEIQGPGGHMSLDGERSLVDAAKANIRSHPWAWTELAVRKAGRMLIGGPKWHFFPMGSLRWKSRTEGRTRTLIVFAWWTVLGTIITVCGLVGLITRLREGGAVFLFALALVVYLVAVHSVSYALPRFAVPLWPAFVLGCAALIAQRPGRFLTVAMTLGWVVVVGYITFAYWQRPQCEVSADRPGYFTIVAAQSTSHPESPTLTLELNGIRPAYNTCIFVTAKLRPVDGKRRFDAALRLESDRSTKGRADAPTIGFPVIADGRPHTYLLCTELNPAWRDRKWGAVRMGIDGINPDAIDELTLQIGH